MKSSRVAHSNLQCEQILKGIISPVKKWDTIISNLPEIDGTGAEKIQT
jgi:hypothetical protein